jgi:hypothetical protein
MGHNEAANPPCPATMMRPKGEKAEKIKRFFLKSFFSNVRIIS